MELSNLFIREFKIDWGKIQENSFLQSIAAVSYGFNAEGGTLNYNFSTYAESHELASAIRLTKGIHRPQAGYFFRAESFFNVATASEKYGTKYGGKRLHSQSHGESFLAFFQEFSNRRGIYIMDEPEAALSPQRQLTLLLIIAEMAKNGSQFIIATHSPILLAFPNAQILEFDKDGIKEVSYTETEHYKITKSFLDNPEKMLYYLFD
jgi:predicted ATPase